MQMQEQLGRRVLKFCDLAAIRLDDNAKQALASLLSDSQDPVLFESSSSWDGICKRCTLLTPVECERIWRQFKASTDSTIREAKDVLLLRIWFRKG